MNVFGVMLGMNKKIEIIIALKKVKYVLKPIFIKLIQPKNAYK